MRENEFTELPGEGPRGLFALLSPVNVLFLALGLLALNILVQLLLDTILPEVYLAILAGNLLVLIGVPWMLARRAGHSPASTYRLRALSASQWGWSALLTVGLVIPVAFLNEVNVWMVPVPDYWEEALEQLRPDRPLRWALAGLTACVAAPVGEELVFRGMIQQAARPSLGPIRASILCGVLFALVHIQPWFVVGLALLGIALGLAYEATGSLLAPIWIHGLYNAISLTALAWQAEDDTPTLLESPAGPPLALAGLLLSYIAWRRLATKPQDSAAIWSSARSSDPD